MTTFVNTWTLLAEFGNYYMTEGVLPRIISSYSYLSTLSLTKHSILRYIVTAVEFFIYRVITRFLGTNSSRSTGPQLGGTMSSLSTSNGLIPYDYSMQNPQMLPYDRENDTSRIVSYVRFVTTTKNKHYGIQIPVIRDTFSRNVSWLKQEGRLLG